MPRVYRLAPRLAARVALIPLTALVILAATVREPAAARVQRGVVAYIIPQQQPDQAALKTLLAVLIDHGVEIRRALAPFASGRVRYSAGAYIIVMPQARGAAASAVLDNAAVDAAASRRGSESVSAAPAPGDTTAFGLASLLGVGVAAVRDSFPVPVTPPAVPQSPKYVTPAGLGDSGRRVVGVYVPPGAGRPVAWTRATLDRFGVAYAPVDAGALRAGDALRQRYDVVMLPDAGAAPYAALDGAGMRAFLDDGGTIVAVGSGARWAERALRLPGRFDDIAPVRASGAAGTAGASGGDGDSALVRLAIDHASPLAMDMVAHAVAWVAGGPATVFTPDTTHSHVVARFDPGAGVSGSRSAAEGYEGVAAVVDVPQRHGRVVLFAFDPAYRGVSLATLPLLWSALRHRDP